MNFKQDELPVKRKEIFIEMKIFLQILLSLVNSHSSLVRTELLHHYFLQDVWEDKLRPSSTAHGSFFFFLRRKKREIKEVLGRQAFATIC